MFNSNIGYNFSSVFFSERMSFLKNCFNLDVSFNSCPLYPYEWDSISHLTHVKLEKVSTQFLKKVLTFNGKIVNASSQIILLSDAKEAVVLKLSKDGEILKRSFLEFDKALDVCEQALNMKESKLEFISNNTKLVYPKALSLETEVKNYIIDAINKNKDEYFSRYLYYLYYDNLEGYTREKLLKAVDDSSIDKNIKLYKFLIE